MSSIVFPPSASVKESSLLFTSFITPKTLIRTQSVVKINSVIGKGSSRNVILASSQNNVVSPVIDSPHRKAAGKPIVVIDNYDSFTYNLCQYLGELGCNFEVYRNDELTVDELQRKNPRGVLISPGPGTPQDSGISLQTVLELGPSVPLFGVCMGLQCIGEVFGGIFNLCHPVSYLSFLEREQERDEQLPFFKTGSRTLSK